MTEIGRIEIMHFPIETTVMLVLYFMIGLYAIFSGILYYHWKTYGTDAKVSGLTLLLYFGVTIPLILVMITIALIIT
ncbi:hypothetical protein H6784_01960 [Candidatus Nomurabacteria bacterium]|nr:hypothetical protein [Candidatus Kaiserbacteria bacterium]MCB9814160.1 hypothetical protein [Candidatus Nomurabacteria bacterium]